MSYPKMARDFLEIYLPIVLRETHDLQTLKLESISSIEQDLRAYYSDVVWSLKAREGPGYIYCVIEHQSTVVPHMAFYLMRYAITVMQHHLDVGNKALSLVIPMLFYHGQQSPYSWSLNWLNELGNLQLARQPYSEVFLLVDITIIPDDGIAQHRRVALLELTQRHIRDHDLMGLVDRLVSLSVTNTANDNQLQTLFNYLIRYGNVSHINEFIREVAERSPQHKKKPTTIAERLRQEGHQSGLQEGIQQGLEQGTRKGLEQGVWKGTQEEVLCIAHIMLEQDIDRDLVQLTTGLLPGDTTT